MMKNLSTVLISAGLLLISNCAQETTENTGTKRLPDAIIYGVRKAGTRALLEFLSIHTKIAKANREIHFFDRDENYGDGNWTFYRSKMPACSPEDLIMEKTPRYFVVRKAQNRIKELEKERQKECAAGLSKWSCSPIKLILIIREPVSRLISDITQLEYKRAERGNALENYNFDFEKEVFKPGQIGLNYDSQPVKTSVYAHFYRRWLNNFPSSQLLLIDGNELKKTPWTSVQKVEDFLNLPSMVTEDDFIFKEERGFFCIRNDPVYGERCLSASKGRSHIEVSDATRAKLRKMYKHHNEDFYKLVDRRFDWDD